MNRRSLLKSIPAIALAACFPMSAKAEQKIQHVSQTEDITHGRYFDMDLLDYRHYSLVKYRNDEHYYESVHIDSHIPTSLDMLIIQNIKKGFVDRSNLPYATYEQTPYIKLNSDARGRTFVYKAPDPNKLILETREQLQGLTGSWPVVTFDSLYVDKT